MLQARAPPPFRFGAIGDAQRGPRENHNPRFISVHAAAERGICDGCEKQENGKGNLSRQGLEEGRGSNAVRGTDTGKGG